VHQQNATLPVRQPARERIEQRERRDVICVKVACLAPEGAHRAVGHPAEAGDDKSQVMDRQLDVLGSSGRIVKRQQVVDDDLELELRSNNTVAQPCAWASLFVGWIWATPTLGAEDVIKMFPAPSLAQPVRQGHVTVRKGVVQREWVDGAFDRYCSPRHDRL